MKKVIDSQALNTSKNYLRGNHRLEVLLKILLLVSDKLRCKFDHDLPGNKAHFAQEPISKMPSWRLFHVTHLGLIYWYKHRVSIITV
jgi:hypothetical protein